MDKAEEQDVAKRLHNLSLMFFASFVALFAAAYFFSPVFASLVNQAFGGLNDAVVTMVAWCRSF